MSSVAEPKVPPSNRIGLTVKEYGGLKSTLCVGCGHDVITRQIMQALYDMGVPPHRVAKFSGIGCSSKTTAYFADRGHGSTPYTADAGGSDRAACHRSCSTWRLRRRRTAQRGGPFV